MHPLEISVEDLAHKLAQREDFCMLDVREAHELDIVCFASATHIPLASLPDRMADLPRDKPLVVSCHHGGRSMRAVQFLRAKGYDNAINLRGGIDAYAVTIDTTMRRY